MFKPSLIGIMLFVVVVTIFSCSNDKKFDIGEDLLTIKSDVIVIDTCTIHTYTVKVDSVVTSGSGKALVGYYNDGNFGKIKAYAYLQFGLPSDLNIYDNSEVDNAKIPIYDSICLRLKTTGYYYGDTTKKFKANLYRITDELVNSNLHPYYYNTSVLNADWNEVLGSCSTIIRPSRKDTVSIPISETFGRDIFNMILTKNEKVKNLDNFISKVLGGIVVVPDETDVNGNIPVYQFNTSEKTAMISLYYHVGRTQKTLTFKSINTTYQFNHIDADYADSPLKALGSKEDKLPSELTGNVSYVQAGTGIMTRFEFPYLGNIIKAYSSYKILKAQLILRPQRGTFQSMALPDSLYLYVSDKFNKIKGNLTNSQNKAILPTFVLDKMYNETAYYFDVTSYINSVIQPILPEAPSLMVSPDLSRSGYTLERIIFGGQNHPTNPVSLRITYWKY